MGHATLASPPAHAHQTTKTRCRIFHIGLDARETLVIESMFRMNPELGNRFVFGAPEDGDNADVMFVDGDSDIALAEWRRIALEHPECVPIIACSDDRDFGAVRTIRKPLAFRNFTAILDAITSTEGAYFSTTGADDKDTLHILVVDDSFPARRFMQIKLEELAGPGMKVRIELTDSGEKALECAHQRTYDLVFLDVVMSGIDGYETCRLLKAIQPVRVVMLTGRTAPVDFSRGRESGCDNYMPKPPNDIDLRTILRLTSLKKMTAVH